MFRDITSTNHGGFYCLGCFHLFRTEEAFKTYEPVCDDNDYCNVILPKEGKNAPKHFHGKYSLKWDMLSMQILKLYLKSIHHVQINGKNLYSKTVSTHTPSGFSITVVS